MTRHTIKSKPRLTAGHAWCTDCAWDCEVDDFAAREAAKHALRMNHVVYVEQTHLYEVRPRKSRKRETP